MFTRTARVMLGVEMVGVCALAYWLLDARHRIGTERTLVLSVVLLVIAAGSLIHFRRYGRGETATSRSADGE